MDKFSITGAKEILNFTIVTNLNINFKNIVFFFINKTRTSPSEFVEEIEQDEKCIKEIDRHKVFDRNKIKVSLNEGKIIFKDCEEYLKKLSPMKELNFCDDIVLESQTKEKKNKRIKFI